MSVRIMGQIWDLALPHAEAWVLMALADHSDHNGGNAFPGQALLAYKTGYSERQVRRILDSLEHKQIIIAEGGGRGRGAIQHYRIVLGNAPRKPPITGQNVRLSAKKKEDKMSGFSDKKSGQNVRSKEDKMSAFPEEKADILSPEKRTFPTQKADISDTSHDKERARVLTVHEPSIEPSHTHARAREVVAETATSVWESVFGEHPGNFQDARIDAAGISDLVLWRETLTMWWTNQYSKRNLTRIIEVYREKFAAKRQEQGNGRYPTQRRDQPRHETHNERAARETAELIERALNAPSGDPGPDPAEPGEEGITIGFRRL